MSLPADPPDWPARSELDLVRGPGAALPPAREDSPGADRGPLGPHQPPGPLPRTPDRATASGARPGPPPADSRGPRAGVDARPPRAAGGAPASATPGGADFRGSLKPRERSGGASVSGLIGSPRSARSSAEQGDRPGLPWLGALRADCRSFMAQASPWPRLPLLALMLYWAVRQAQDFGYRGLIGGLNFGIHELGHVLCAPFGTFIEVAGGSALQLLAPTISLGLFLRQRDYFACGFALVWLGTNWFEVAQYAGDARSQSLPLVGLGAGEPLHDWAYLLGKLDLLRQDQRLAGLLRLFGAAAYSAGLALGAWLLVGMFRRGRSEGA